MSALINPTFWLAMAVFAVAIGPMIRRQSRLAGLLKCAASRPVLVLIAGMALANVCARALIGLAVPGDFVQEAVAAQSFQREGTLFARDINNDVQQWLGVEPPLVPSWLPDRVETYLRERQTIGRNRLVTQAHPPTLLIAVAPWIWLFGAHVTYVLMTLATIAAAVITSQLLVSAWKDVPSSAERWLAALAFVSWQPVLASVRDGQVSVVIGAFLVGAWSAARAGRFIRTGALVGIAAALKLYPAALLVLLAARRRAALAVALSIIAGAGWLVTLVAGLRVWGEFLVSAQAISRSFAASSHNLAVIARVAPAVPTPWLPFWYAVLSAGLVAVTFLAVGSDKWRDRGSFAVDLEFGLFICLAMLLSPIAWHHYTFMLAQPLALALIAAQRSPHRWPLVCWALCVLVLALPDDVIRQMWAVLSPGPVVVGVLSPGIAVLLLWASLVYLRRSGAVADTVRVSEAVTATI